MRTSELFETLLCGPDGKVVVGSEPEKKSLDEAIEEVRRLESLVYKEKPDGMIFCKTCKHFNDGEFGEWCSKVIGTRITPKEIVDVTIGVYEKWNKGNDCGHYEISWTARLWQRITGREL